MIPTNLIWSVQTQDGHRKASGRTPEEALANLEKTEITPQDEEVFEELRKAKEEPETFPMDQYPPDNRMVIGIFEGGLEIKIWYCDLLKSWYSSGYATLKTTNIPPGQPRPVRWRYRTEGELNNK